MLTSKYNTSVFILLPEQACSLFLLFIIKMSYSQQGIPETLTCFEPGIFCLYCLICHNEGHEEFITRYHGSYL